MKRRDLVLLASLVSTSSAAAPELSADEKQFMERVSPPVVLTAPGMDRIRVERDLVYARSGQKADVYRAAKPGGGVLIFLHGGMGPEFPVRPKEWGIYQSWGRLVAASGMTALVVNHRAGFPRVELAAATDDVRDAVAFARARARGWGADATRICLAAFSGGGPLLSYGYREAPPEVRCLVGVYPILDLEAELFKSQMGDAERATYSPLEQVAKKPALPTLILRAGNDSIPGLLVGLDRFVKVAIEKDAALTLINVPGAPHGFDNRPEVPRARAAVQALVAFVSAELAPR